MGRVVARVAGLGAGALHVRHETLELPHWPAALSGLRVAVVADVHAGSPQVDEERLDLIVDLVNHEAVELIALLGDYIDPEVMLGEWIEPETIAAKLAGMRSEMGTFAVLGNHDWRHAGARMGEALVDAGIPVLENAAVDTDGLWIAGLGDLTTREADLEGTFALVPEGRPVILLSHNPDVFPRVPDFVSLTLAGHTHGAQVDVPVVRDKVTPSRFGARYIGGHIEEGGRHLYVSDGIGTSRFPVRFRARPQIPVLELRSWTNASRS